MTRIAFVVLCLLLTGATGATPSASQIPADALPRVQHC